MNFDAFLEHPFLFPFAVIFSTFISEDPTTIGVGALIGSGQISFIRGFLPLMCGIILGDLGLYGVGTLIRKGWKKSAHFPITPSLMTLFIARFVPGMRSITFTSAGVKQFPFKKYAMLLIPASVIWTLILLTATKEVMALMNYFPKWVSILIGLSVFAFFHVLDRCLRKKYLPSQAEVPAKTDERL
ncbi:MAG: DedA family protein [Bacteriovoracaceae bacterium]